MPMGGRGAEVRVPLAQPRARVVRVFIINTLERVWDMQPRSRRSAGELEAVLRTLIFEGIGAGPGPRSAG